MTSPARWAGRAAGAAVLVVLAMRFGGEPFRHGLVSVGPAALAVALAVGALTTLACAWRWRLVARHLGLELPLGVSFAACYRAQLLNASLPGGVLGDVHRAVDRGRHARATGRPSPPTSASASRAAASPPIQSAITPEALSEAG